MTNFDNFLNFLIEKIIPQLTFWEIVKVFVIIIFFLYLGFALVLVKQVSLMGKTLDGEFKKVLKLISWIHLLAAVLVLLICFLIL